MSAASIAIMTVGSILGVVFVLLLFAGKKYDSWIEPLDSKEYPLCELYGLGFILADILKFNYTTKTERKRRQQIALLIGEKHSEFYLHVNVAERFTLAAVAIVFAFILYGLSSEWVMLLVGGVFGFVAYYYVSTLPEVTLQKKSAKILGEFADVVSKLALLVNAGMIMREAWEKVAYTGEGELYQEMRHSLEQMNNGVSEVDAYTEFGTRCTSPEIKKFTSTIVQGLVKGNRELVEMIKQQSREIWDAKRHNVKQQGEKAATKLMIPMMIMFGGILVMIVVPIFANLGV